MSRMNMYFLTATGWLFALLWVSFSLNLQGPSVVRVAAVPLQCKTFPAAVLTWFSSYRGADIPVSVCITGPGELPYASALGAWLCVQLVPRW